MTVALVEIQLRDEHSFPALGVSRKHAAGALNSHVRSHLPGLAPVS